MGKLFRKYAFLLLAVVAAGGVSCTDEGPDNSPNDPLKVSRKSILVGGDAELVTISVNSLNGTWTLTGDDDWCRVSPQSGEKGLSVATVTFTENDGIRRKTTFEIVSGDVRREITVAQLAAGEKITTPNQNNDYYINEYVRENILYNWYLWRDEAISTAADYNQDYDRFVRNYLMYLKKNDLDGGIWSETNERYVYSYIERRPRSMALQPKLNYGMEFELTTLSSNTGTKMVGRVLYVMPGSPAAAAGLKRGEWFHRVNGRSIEDWNYDRRIDSLVRPVEGVDIRLGMVKRAYSGNMEEYSPQREVTLTPAHFRGSPILHSDVITRRNTEGVDIHTGYLMYNSFDPAYKQELIDLFAEKFKGHKIKVIEDGKEVEVAVGIDNLILDLRYNHSGSVEMAELMANLIAPQTVKDNDRTLVTYDFFDHERTVKFEPHESGIGVDKLIVIGTQNTAGASELVINAFNELEEVGFVLIGSTTEGMSAGMAALRDVVESTEYVYDVYPVAFSCSNDAGHGKYKHGFSPNGQQVSEWAIENIVWDTQFGVYTGKSRDALLGVALQYADGSMPVPANPASIQSAGTKLGKPRLFSVQPAMTMERESF